MTQRVCNDVMSATGLPVSCVLPVFGGKGHSVVIELKAARHVTLRQVWRTASHLASGAREAVRGDAGAFAQTSCLHHLASLSITVSPNPPALAKICTAYLSLGRDALCERSAACCVVLPALRHALGGSALSGNGVLLDWVDPEAVTYSASCSGKELQESARRRLSERCRLPCGGRLIVRLGRGDDQHGSLGECGSDESVTLWRHPSFMSGPAWEDVSMRSPAAFATYTRGGACGIGKGRGGYRAAFIGFRADSQVVRGHMNR